MQHIERCRVANDEQSTADRDRSFVIRSGKYAITQTAMNIKDLNETLLGIDMTMISVYCGLMADYTLHHMVEYSITEFHYNY